MQALAKAVAALATLPSCLRSATHFLQGFPDWGHGAPAFTDFPEGTQTVRGTWELPSSSSGLLV